MSAFLPYLNQMLLIALPVAAPFLFALGKKLVNNLPAAQQQRLLLLVHSAVVAAEQVYADIPGSGQAKKQFVVSRIEAIFGKKVNAALVEVLLEEAVAHLSHSSLTSSSAPSSLV